LTINKINAKKSFLIYLPFVIFFAIVFIWHFKLSAIGDDLIYNKLYYGHNIFVVLSSHYENWTSRVLIEFFLIPLAGLPRIVWNFFDSIIFLLIAVLIPKIASNNGKINEKKSFILNSLSCILVLIYIFTISSALNSTGNIATTLNYTWPLFFGLLHFYLVKKYVFNENNSGTIKKIVIYAVMIFALIFAINQEILLMTISVAYFLIIMYCLYNKVKIPNSIFLMLFIIFLGYLNVYLSPGNHARILFEISSKFPDYNNLTLVNKIDLGITVLFNRIMFSHSLINLIFFAVLGVYVYSLTKKNTSIIISSLPIIIIITLGLMAFIGYLPIVEFINEGITKYGLLHSDLNHIVINFILYAIIMISVFYNLLQIYKYRGKKLSYIIFCLLILGFTSQMIRGFSPTVWASAERWEIYYYFFITCITYILTVELFEGKYRLKILVCELLSR